MNHGPVSRPFAASLLALTVLATGCGPQSSSSLAPARGNTPAQGGGLLAKDIGLTANDVVVSLLGCTRSGSTDSCSALTPSANGAVVQSGDDNPAAYDNGNFILHLPAGTDLSKAQLIQAKATGHISANAKVYPDGTDPSYVRIRIYVTGTKAGGTLSSIEITQITDLSVTATSSTSIAPGGTVNFAVSATDNNGGTITNPTVNVSSQGGDTVQNDDGTYTYTAGSAAGSYTITFSAGSDTETATINVESPPPPPPEDDSAGGDAGVGGDPTPPPPPPDCSAGGDAGEIGC